ncbi:glutamate-1-semialdehyde-2,1-aminomutase [Thermovibrio ammonificans HB-1]|jgi:glutamate-1-semialdehyde 2,1-aminomutase|uniref:Glutamate-1-semialdehyde 2,1-aminomutase n=1 Tax=Thermovibrio ammonificans (strain DSM 15698 / JCM 12110 / HB-1) TaxID=648996 RepID=E8T525_THEA1|nr:glutamate-1-semialdehyde 2,1-aminomutase [Thermovibrio ammonificans]ADU97557.1 glutamate-1-semialdehyde-2,1-aminomutase [Thermovibrio ammonificans HB-1]
MRVERSKALFEEAKKYIPGGVNSPVRAFKSVGDVPRFIERAKGSHIWDVDGNEYIDYVCSWGPMILGHAHPKVVEAIQKQAEKGTSYGAPTELEVELAKMIVELVPSVEKVRMVNSGTEATMSAIRLARGYTGRNKVIKFEGGYHGHVDALLVKAGSGLTTFGVPTSPGIPEDFAKHTITVPFNDIDALKRVIDEVGHDVAAVIMEPVMANAGLIIPEPGFLEAVRELTAEKGIVLIFDEVITGFRLSLGGAQEYFGVTPDLSCFGKIIGGGLPVGAFGGKAEIMDHLAPEGPVYQAGTLSGNPLAMAAGIATLKELQKPGVYQELRSKTEKLSEGLKEAAKAAGIYDKLHFKQIESISIVYFTPKEVKNYQDALTSNTQAYAAFFRKMLQQGVYLAPSQFEVAFMSTAHTQEDIEKTVKAAEVAFKEAAQLL